MPKISPDRPPPPKKFTFIEQNDFVMQQNQQDLHILDHSDAFAVTQSAKDLTRGPSVL